MRTQIVPVERDDATKIRVRLMYPRYRRRIWMEANHVKMIYQVEIVTSSAHPEIEVLPTIQSNFELIRKCTDPGHILNYR